MCLYKSVHVTSKSASGSVLDTAQGQIITKNIDSLKRLRFSEKPAVDFIKKADNGKWLASGSGDKTAKVWEVVRGKTGAHPSA